MNNNSENPQNSLEKEESQPDVKKEVEQKSASIFNDDVDEIKNPETKQKDQKEEANSEQSEIDSNLFELNLEDGDSESYNVFEDSDAFAEDDLFSDNIQDLDKNDNSVFQKPKKKKSKLKEYAFVGKKPGKQFDTSPEAVLEKEQKRKKTLVIFGVIAGLLALAYLGGVFYFQNRFLPNTTVNGASISNMTLDEAQQVVSELPQERTVEIIGSDGVKSEVKASDVGFNLVESTDLGSELNKQNAFKWPVTLIKQFGDSITNESSINEEALTNTVANLEIVAGPQVVKTENARAEYNGSEFIVRPEVFGTEVDVPKLIENVRESLVNGDPMINLEEEENYVMPVTLEDSEVLAQSIQQLNSILGTVVTYDFKTSQEVVDKNTFIPWLSTADTGEAVVNQDMAAAYVASLAQKYDTVGVKTNFTTSSGTPIQVTDWVVDGWQINQPQETADLSNLILTGQTVTKEPAYNSTGRDRAWNNTVSGTYLEISIADQTMWYYQNGQLITSTPVVTGDPTQGHGTPVGLFDVQAKNTNVVLRGADYASPVTFWIPFDGGVGVHDASWRGSFGGSIYWGNGSHGCVNTPYSAVRTIYNSISVGEPVVVY